MKLLCSLFATGSVFGSASFLVACAALLSQACSAAVPAQPEIKDPSSKPEAAEVLAEEEAAVEVAQEPALESQVARKLPTFCEGPLDVAPFEKEAQAGLIQEGFVFVEGPVWSEKKGSFFFSEMNFEKEGPNGPPAKIHQLILATDSEKAKVEVFIEDSGSNGLAIDNDALVACTHDKQVVSRYDLGSKERSVLVADFGGKHFNSPNDVTLHSDGHLYFTDPDWQLGKRTSETGMTGVYMKRAGGNLMLVDGSLPKPNGITLSPDETRLYVGAVNGEISVYPVAADGSVGARTLFAKVDQPDGMAVDCAGNLYVTSHGPGQVVVLSPEAQVISTIKVAPRTTNVAFGGPGRKTLLITAGTGVYSIQSALPGFPY